MRSKRQVKNVALVQEISSGSDGLGFMKLMTLGKLQKN